MSNQTHTQRKEHQAEYEGWIRLLATRFTHHITLNPHRPAGLDRGNPRLRGADAHSLLRRWDARMNRELVGKGWQNPNNKRLRCRWIAVPEGHELNRHWHLLFKLSPDLSPLRLEDVCIKYFVKSTDHNSDLLSLLANRHWKAVAPSGTARADLISSATGISHYLSKQMYLEELQGGLISSLEFQSD